MELHQLRYFVAVAETGSFTAAARRCYVAQPSLSQQIKKLEDELGHPLFNRLGRRAPLTEPGVIFLAKARQILLGVEDARHAVQDDAGTAPQQVTIGIIPTLAPSLVPRVLQRCRSGQPPLDITVQEETYRAIIESVRSGAINLGIVPMPEEDLALTAEPLFEEPLQLVLPAAHPLAHQARVTPDDLAAEPFVLLGDQSTLTTQLRRFFGRAAIEPRIVARCMQVATVKALIAGEAAISILPQTCRAATDDPLLVWREISGHPMHRQVAILTDPRRYLSRGAARFVAVLRNVVAESLAGKPATARAPVPRRPASVELHLS